MLTPQEYWEDSDVHPPLSNPPRLLSNGHGFIEVPWSSQYMFIHTGSSSPGPVPSASVSAPMDVAIELVDPNPQWGPNIASEHHKVTSNLLSPHQSSAFQPSPHQSAACQPSPQPLLAPPYSRLRQSPTSHTAHTASHLSPTSTTTSTRASTPPISDEEARWTLSIWIMSSDWLRKDEMEPMVGDPGVPPCALQLASKGESVYSCFLVPVIDGDGKLSGYKSTAYPTSKADRHQRAIARERANRGHCPFKCPGNHDPNWYARSLVVIDPLLT